VAIRTPEEEEKKRKQRLRREGYAEKEGFKRGTHTGDVVVTPTRQRIDDTAFSVAAPRARNTLPTRLKLDHYFSSSTENVSVQVFETDDSVLMSPRSPSRKRSISTSVTVTVIY